LEEEKERKKASMMRVAKGWVRRWVRRWVRKLRIEAGEVLRGRTTARILSLATAFVVIVVLLVLFLDWYIAPEKPGERKDLVLAAAQILGGTALLSGLYFTWRNLQVNREGQITERFTRAIDQLGETDDDGNKRLEIRLGGVYALERIARDSEDDHGPIVEVLTAYVREHAPWPPKPSEANEEAPRPEPDVQAVLTVLGRRTRYYGSGEGERLDLAETDLRGSHLREAHLEGAVLREAHLEGARLSGARLEGAYLYKAHLEGARLAEARLEGAVLAAARLEGAHLEGAHLREARLEGAYLYKAHLEGAHLERAHLEGADLSKAIGLTQEQIGLANGNRQTKLPDGLDHPARWD
jgi:hypothetical protein